MAAGVPVEVVPGVTSAIAVPALAGIPVTHRGVTDEFVVVSGHLPPDDSRTRVDWPSLARLRGTLVVLMGVANLAAFSAVLIDNGKAPSTPVTVIQDGTMPTEKVVRTTLAGLPRALADHDVRPPAIAVVGEVAARGAPA